MARSNFVTGFSTGKSKKTVDFSETIAPCDLKVGRYRQLIMFMKVCETVSIQGHFLTLAQGHLHMKIKTCFSQKPLGHFSQILYASFSVHGNVNLLT